MNINELKIIIFTIPKYTAQIGSGKCIEKKWFQNENIINIPLAFWQALNTNPFFFFWSNKYKPFMWRWDAGSLIHNGSY